MNDGLNKSINQPNNQSINKEIHELMNKPVQLVFHPTLITTQRNIYLKGLPET